MKILWYGKLLNVLSDFTQGVECFVEVCLDIYKRTRIVEALGVALAPS